MSVRPVVDAVEREFGNRLLVIRLNVQDPAGDELAASFRSEFTPTFILFAADGRELWRSVFALDPARLRDLLRLE
jgi:hypothetical protein